jgi:hypothetical protein
VVDTKGEVRGTGKEHSRWWINAITGSCERVLIRGIVLIVVFAPLAEGVRECRRARERILV